MNAGYARSLSCYGTPVELPLSGGWVLERRIPDSALTDAMGPYPFFACRDWSALPRDLDGLSRLVTLTLVTDPFGEYDPMLLRACFPDLVRPFKDHFVTDLRCDPDGFVAAHHRRNAKRALAAVEVEACPDPALYAGDWVRLYAQLVARHSVTGLADFPLESLRAQLSVPGLEMFRAVYAGETAGIVLWMTRGPVAYYHLGAYSDAGYRLGASFAIFRTAIDHFSRKGFQWLSLGAGPGIHEGAGGGLARFKRGWATGARPVYLCGRVFDREAYDRLLRDTGTTEEGYFPAYRKGEFR